MRKLFFFLACIGFAQIHAEEELPPVATATVSTAKVPTEQVTIAEVELAKVVTPAVNTVTFTTFPMPEVAETAEVPPLTATVEVAAVATASGNLTAVKAFKEELENYFRDKRNILHDCSAVPGNAVFEAWLDIYKAHTDYTSVYKPLRSDLRMIAELTLPVKQEILTANLAFYRNAGYNSILVTFSGNENPGELSSLVKQCRAAGLAPYFAYGGKEDLKQSVFIAPATLKRLIEELAPLCDGMFLNWRRTSCHLFLPDRAFTDYLIRNARASNPELQIIGESYYGSTGEAEGIMAVTTSVPANASGVLLVNAGFLRVNASGVLENVFRAAKDMNRLVLIVGERPYYQSGSPQRSFLENFKIKQNLEKKFRAAGAAGTVTLHGDGSGLYDNLAHVGQK